jgi:hypothetical protein
MLPSFHDALVIGFSVLSEDRELRIDFRLPGSNEKLSLHFTGVEAYRFGDDAFGNIVGEFIEVPAIGLFSAHSNHLRESFQRSGSPGAWVLSEESAIAYLNSKGVRGFTLDSSIGLSGWVFARACTCAA